MRNIWTCGMAVLILLGSTLTVAARTAPTDEEIKSRAMHELFDAGFVRVSVAVENGNVTLTGSVPSIWAKGEAIKRVRKVRGVTQVTSAIEIVKAEGDSILGRDVGRELRGSSYLSVFDLVNATVLHGVITLTGDVTSPFKADRLVDAVSRLEGAQEVINQITVLPPSTSDDQTRLAVADRIYNSPAFLRYSPNVNAPIRILVRNGHVRLAGVVASDGDKTMAAMLAGGVFGVRDVKNDLQVEQ